MTSFEGELRHYCRSPKCRTKLKEPAANMHKAFCSRGCHDGFYANRCLVCEKEKPKGSRTDRKLCRRSECRSAYRQNRLIFTFPVHPASLRTLSSKSAHSTGIKTGDFRHCATVPDGPNGRWPGGRYERIEAANRHLLEAHFDKLDSTATDFCADCGRDDDLVDCQLIPNRWMTICRDCRAKRLASQRRDPAAEALVATIADDLSIPKFLQRVAAPDEKAAA